MPKITPETPKPSRFSGPKGNMRVDGIISASGNICEPQGKTPRDLVQQSMFIYAVLSAVHFEQEYVPSRPWSLRILFHKTHGRKKFNSYGALPQLAFSAMTVCVCLSDVILRRCYYVRQERRSYDLVCL